MIQCGMKMRQKGLKMRGRGWPVILAMLLGMAGCTTKEDRVLFETVKTHSGRLRAAQQTEEIVFQPGTEEESILIATYLPKESGAEGEAFVMACAPGDQLHPGDFRLEGKKALHIGRISHRLLPSSLKGSIPSWFETYRVLYPAVTQKRFSLSMEKGGKRYSRFFYKGPKYLVNKKSFKY